MGTTNLTLDSESICDPNYDILFENAIYFVTACYLSVGLFCHISLLKIILISDRKYFKDNSFFVLFRADLFASTTLLLYDIFFGRIFMYIPQLCPFVSTFFSTPTIFLKVLYVAQNHARFVKSLSQIFMVLNRMSCVLMPATYNQFWNKITPIASFIMLILPFAGLWNIMISQVIASSVRGGFGVDYIKAVKWASLSLFQSICILTALGFTIVCTSVTFYKLACLSDRVRSIERSLCFTSISISCTFLLVAGTQLTFATCASCKTDAMYILQFLAFDTFNVGSAIIMFLTNRHLRSSMFSSQKKRAVTVVTVGQISTNTYN
ncbi:Serpentine receptor class gamma-17 [Caenorhabditis elegans]|uniref:Serpentine receptor class gamma-17 n=1 Tax=Caenorhabditis elegans TaxID=6239 RepID=SRG17_CAEEL|nr:Serpentine receptor class gamma-17 [Caenorhabditis elegans]O17820.2 RecName: Full=Serpentine receptor class gamma-17; Short=Protein srg-17 [Caenorhabditis elegans]CAB02949.2 Serpentine receptor class gamma-17 [Caenorhabditis elegans]|eukprot:NP_496659.2 Serpentine receptor class gamma-17 [Caenorhabditis elegans]